MQPLEASRVPQKSRASACAVCCLSSLALANNNSNLGAVCAAKSTRHLAYPSRPLRGNLSRIGCASRKVIERYRDISTTVRLCTANPQHINTKQEGTKTSVYP